MIEVHQVAGTRPVTRFRLARELRGRPAYFTAAYWVDGLLIDTGCAHTALQLNTALKGWRVDTIVNTHSHEDHIGGNAIVQETHRCPILAHPDALPILQRPRLQPLQLYRRVFWGWPQPSRGDAIGERVETRHYCFQVVLTPGHSRDHICLFEPEQGWLFSGDAYVGGKDRALRQGYDIHGIIASLKKLAELPVQMIFAGSGSVRTDGAEHLREKIDYLEDLGDRIWTLHREGLSDRRIGRRLLGRELPIAYVTLGHFSRQRLVRSYLAQPASGTLEGEATSQDPDTEHSPATQPELR